MILKNKAFLKGAFFGFTIIWLIIWFLHRGGFMHVYTEQSTLQQFTKFEREISTYSVAVDRSIEGLEIIQSELIKAINIEQKPYVLYPNEGFQFLNKSWPELYKKVSNLAPPDGAFIFKVVDDEFKVLVSSQLCSITSMYKPEYVDVSRKKYIYICEYYGVWSKNGEGL